MNTARCHRFSEDVVGLLEGTANDDLRQHVASCDACRDQAHNLRELTSRIGRAGDDYVLAPPLAERLAAVARLAEEESAKAESADRISVTRLRAEALAGAAASGLDARAPARSINRKALWLIVAACASVTASAVIGVKVADHQRSPSAVAARAWHGKVAKIVHSGADTDAGGLTVWTGGASPGAKVPGVPVAEGAEIKPGMRIATDGRTRARLWFDDGTTVVLDRASELTVENSPRTLSLADGALLADVAHIEGAAGAIATAVLKTPNGDVTVLGTKLALTAAPDRTNVEVLRGEVDVRTGSDSQRVSAGQEGVASKDGKVDVAPVNDLAQRAAFGEQLIATHNEDTDAPASGLGELRAKRPGKTDEKDHAVHLQKHAVKVRIAGNVARTEIDETFANDTDDELEGIYRFPLPPGAQIERLALEVDGKLVDGEFVDKAKASAIWRGAIQNAAPKAPKPKEEIVWVPGPWHDPALLEWQRGGRFELRIFPIPKRGSRRVVIAYTESVAPVSGVRRYVYPLPQGSSSNLSIDQFTVDAQVLGHDAKVPVRARGYELAVTKDAGSASEHLTTSLTAFVPSGDLAIEYGLDDKATDLAAWAYRAEPVAPKDAKTPDPIGADPFVAIALRPKLPKWSESKPRDQVIVLDAGRAMYGERFARAKRLAVQMTQEMDRRDRVTVLACDVTCRALPGGFVAPGAPSAHDVDAFLGGLTPEGASDLVGAIRAASRVSGHDGARDLRVTVLSDGVATAGYRSVGRVSTEVGDALGDARSLVVAVPIGADADVNLLGDIARGGGGVVVPYQPGQRLEATAIEVLNATYGTTLRDVEVILPPGLRDAAPAAVAPLRAGSETIITARMSGDSVKGDVIVRGKVGGDPFEARYPVDVRASTDTGNAFVPRLFAAARIADREREPGDSAHAELVALSQRFAVPSRTTSLLVLESEAMFKAFGIARAERGAQWTGETLAQGSAVATLSPAHGAVAGGTHHANAFASDENADEEQAPSEGKSAGREAVRKKESSGPLSLGGGGGTAGADLSSALAQASAAPAATMAPPASPPAKAPFDRGAATASRARRPSPLGGGDDIWEGRRRGGQFMKEIFVRHATVSSDAGSAVTQDKLAQARAAVAASPDERAKHKDLARLLALSGQLDELGETLEQWSQRDPLDADVIGWRADVAARRGDRDTSLRILGGTLAASALTSADAVTVAQAVGRSYDRLGKPEACAFFVTAAELRPSDPDVLARAVSCERASGRVASADRWLVGLKDTQRTALDGSMTKLEKAKSESAFGDVVAAATWSGGADLDVAIVDPQGRRASAVSRMKGSRTDGATSRDHETVGVSSGEAGSFLVEVVRSSAGDGASVGGPVSGTVTIKAFGETQAIPFTLASTAARAPVGRVEVRWQQELVPLDNGSIGNLGIGNGLGDFDRGAAASALANVGLQQCGTTGQVGTGHVNVTFSPTGRVSNVVVDDANFSGTPAGRCVQTAFFRATIAPFAGAAVRVGKSFTIGAPMAR